jgi:WD40 repeat protein
MPPPGYPRPLFSPQSSFPNSADANVPSIAAASVASNVDESVASRFASSDFYVTVSLDGTIQLFSLPEQGFDVKGNLLMTFEGGEGKAVTEIVFSPDSRFLSWGREDGTVELYNIKDKTLTLVVDKPEPPPPCG